MIIDVHSYDNKRNWSMYNGLIIKLDPAKINKGKRMNIHILMIMDEVEVVLIDYQLEVELVPAEHNLD
jgi:hypothetical protein